MSYIPPLTLSDSQLNPTELKQQLDALAQYQKALFLNKADVTELVFARSEYMDQLLQRLWTSAVICLVICCE